MFLVYAIILMLVLIITSGVMGYFNFRAKALQIEKSAKDRGAALSDNERATIEKYHSQSETSLKTTVLGVVACFLLLLQATVNM